MRKNKFLAALAIAACLATSVPLSASAATLGQAASASEVTYSKVSTADQAQIKTVFVAADYAELNPDLAAAGITGEAALFNHFVTAGLFEGRQCNKNFNVAVYRSAYSDLLKEFGNDLVKYYVHYATFGIKEGRSVTTEEAAKKNGVVVKSLFKDAVILDKVAAPAASTSSSNSESTTPAPSKEEEEKPAKTLVEAGLKSGIKYDAATGAYYKEEIDNSGLNTNGQGARAGFVLVNGKYHEKIANARAPYLYDSSKYQIALKKGEYVYADLSKAYSTEEATYIGVDPERFYKAADGYHKVVHPETDSVLEANLFELREERNIEGEKNGITKYARVWNYFNDNQWTYYIAADENGIAVNADNYGTKIEADWPLIAHKGKVYNQLDGDHATVYADAVRANADKLKSNWKKIGATTNYYDINSPVSATTAEASFDTANYGSVVEDGKTVYYAKNSVSASSLRPGYVWVRDENAYKLIVSQEQAFANYKDSDYYRTGDPADCSTWQYYKIDKDLNGYITEGYDKDHLDAYRKYFIMGDKDNIDLGWTFLDKNAAYDSLADALAGGDATRKSLDEDKYIEIGGHFYEVVSRNVATELDDDYAMAGKIVYKKAVTDSSLVTIDDVVAKDEYVYANGGYRKFVTFETAFDTTRYAKTTIDGKDVYYSVAESDESVAATSTGVTVAKSGYILINGNAHKVVSVLDAVEYDVTKYELVIKDGKAYLQEK